MGRITWLVSGWLGLVLLLAVPGLARAQSTSTLFTATQGPCSSTCGGSDQNSVELGLRFSVDTTGTITGIRFWKPTLSDSNHSVELWSGTGTLLTQATSTSETTNGWQEVSISPISVSSGNSYVASYHTHGYASTQAFGWPLVVSPIHTNANAGVYNYSSSASFPSSYYNSSNYWVDVVFTPATTATATPTATTAATSTPTLVTTATPAATVNPTGYTCTEVIGFSETRQWYEGGFISVVPNPGDFQLRWYSGGSIDQWAAGNSFIGWQPANLISHCVNGSAAPDRIILNVSGQYNTDITFWSIQTQLAINYIKNVYDPGVSVIVLQPVVGGPSGSMCPATDVGWVRATYNFPFIEAGFQSLFTTTVQQGAYPEVRSCDDYADSTGHLANATVETTIGSYIAKFYSQVR